MASPRTRRCLCRERDTPRVASENVGRHRPDDDEGVQSRKEEEPPMTASTQHRADSSPTSAPAPVLRWRLVPPGTAGNDAPMLVATWVRLEPASVRVAA